jgi:PKD repeat protein
VKNKILVGIIVLVTMVGIFNAWPAAIMADATLTLSPNTGGSGMLIAVSGGGFTAGTTTTALTITRHNAHGGITATQTFSYTWMESNLPIIGDGTTHYYLNEWARNATTWDQIWDPNETYTDPNVLLDMGTPKGTDLKDLCNLVGTSENDKIVVSATDSFSREFDYENIYRPEPRQGKMIVAWWNASGYVPDYAKGMRLLFMPETTNADGKHIFGFWDMHETIPPAYWGYTSRPETGNISVSNICNIDIYEANLVSCDASGNTREYFAPGETIYVKGAGLTANRNYKLWIQPDPVLTSTLNNLDLFTSNSYLLSIAQDPSVSQESINTDANGDFEPVAIWSNCAAAGPITCFDIVADNQYAGNPGYFDGWDTADSPGLAGFKVASDLPTAAFTAKATSGAAPLTVHFVDQSAGIRPMSYNWDFDSSGIIESADHNPVHTYTTPGTYTVKLSVTSPDGSDQKIKTGFITVTEPQAPVADFTAAVTTGIAPVNIAFTDLSSGSPTAWAWDFDGDNEVDSTIQDPTFRYLTAGTYTVKLSVTNATGVDEKTRTGYIVITAPAVQPAWDLNNDHTCNILDVIKIGLKWSQTGMAGWIAEDANKDGRINILDVIVIGLHWGETW